MRNGVLLIRRWVGRQTTVAQIVNLLYRRLAVGGLRNLPSRLCLGETRRLPTCDTAQRGEGATEGARLCRPDQPQQPRQAAGARTNPTAGCANVLRLVRCGHSRAPFQRCAVGVGLGKAVKEMRRLMKNYRG